MVWACAERVPWSAVAQRSGDTALETGGAASDDAAAGRRLGRRGWRSAQCQSGVAGPSMRRSEPTPCAGLCHRTPQARRHTPRSFHMNDAARPRAGGEASQKLQTAGDRRGTNNPLERNRLPKRMARVCASCDPWRPAAKHAWSPNPCGWPHCARSAFGVRARTRAALCRHRRVAATSVRRPLQSGVSTRRTPKDLRGAAIKTDRSSGCGSKTWAAKNPRKFPHE